MEGTGVRPDSAPAGRPSRREALALGGGAALSALAAAALSGRRVAAQDATPDASPAAVGGLAGQFLVVRIRTFEAGQDIDEAMGLIGDGFVPLVSAIAGFVAYVGSADPATREAIFVGVFADRTGADESNRRAAEWLADNDYDWFEGDPIVFESTIAIAAEA